MAIKKITWRDEVLSPSLPSYDITDGSGRVVAASATLNLVNEVVTSGTPHNAANMSCLVQKCDAVGSFFYKPAAAPALYTYALPMASAAWGALPPCPIDMGNRPVAAIHDGKMYVTNGQFSVGRNTMIIYSVAIYDFLLGEWSVVQSGNQRDFAQGGIEDFRVIDNRLVICGKGRSAQDARLRGWLDAFDLASLTWTFGATALWSQSLQTAGPMVLSPNGDMAVVLGRDGSGGNSVIDIVTPTSTVPLATGWPIANVGSDYVPTGAMFFNENYFLTAPGIFGSSVWRSTTLSHWTQVVPPAGMMGGVLPVGAAIGHALFKSQQGGLLAVDAGFTMQERPLPGLMACTNQAAVAGERLFFNRAGGWVRYDTSGAGGVQELPPGPTNLENHGFCADQNVLYAIKNHEVLTASASVITSGVVLGQVFKGLSISANKEVHLVGAGKTKAIQANKWHRATEDALICGDPDMEVFGHIANK